MKLVATLSSILLLGTGITAVSPTYGAETVDILRKIEVPTQSTRKFSVSELGTEFASRVSPESIEVLEHFGPEAPAILNNYAIALEDALIKVVEENEKLKKESE